jgi:hypothetical protein
VDKCSSRYIPYHDFNYTINAAKVGNNRSCMH